MVLNLRLFQKTSDLENKVDSFFLKLAEAGVIYRLAVRSYLRESLSEEYKTHFEKVCDIETNADTLRSEIKLAIYSDMLIPDSRGDVLGLLEGGAGYVRDLKGIPSPNTTVSYFLFPGSHTLI